MTVKLLVDVNLSAQWVPGLKGPGCPLSIGPTSVIPGGLRCN